MSDSEESSDFTFEDSSESETFKCGECDFVGKNLRGLRMHTTRTHGHKLDVEGDEPPEGMHRVPRQSSLKRKLEEMFTGLGMVVSFKCVHCGTHLASQANDLATAWDKLARENPAVRKALNALLATSAWGEVALITGMTVMPIIQHHNLLKPKPKKNPPQTPEEYLVNAFANSD